ncbi:MAG: exonuclease domain-containing protein [Oscillospiraceae bacterium]
MQKILAFDVETPNRTNDRICQIGMTFIENNIIGDTVTILVNPETFFSNECISIHGITSDMVLDSPTFDQVWEKYKDEFTSSLIVAHNATFDLCVLRKTLSHYNIECPNLYYVCTYLLAKDMALELENLQLPTVCSYLGIDLGTHHDAGYDSLACGKIFIDLTDNNTSLIDASLKMYQMSAVSDNTIHESRKTSNVSNPNTLSLQLLQGLLIGITCDNILTKCEVVSLKQWLIDNSHLSGQYPFDKVFSSIKKSLDDGVLTEDELKYLLNLFKKIINPVEYCECENNADIDFNNKTVCLTGDFDFGDRKVVCDILSQKGALIKSNVINNLDYLIVGGCGSESWSNGTYGGKIKKAFEIQAKGSPVKIIKECDISFILEAQNV